MNTNRLKVLKVWHKDHKITKFLALPSNHRKAVEVPNSERRFFLKVGKQTHNAKRFKELFALAKDAGVCEIFFQFLRTVDISKIEIGRAPLTTVKLESMSAQAPLAIRYLKSAVMDNPRIMCYVPHDIQGDAERCEYAAELDQFRLKSMCESTQPVSSLVGDAFEEYMVQQDLKKFSAVKCKVPTSHVISTVLQQFRGQRYMGGNEEDFLQAFRDLGIPVNKSAKVMNKKKTCIIFPSIEGLVYLMKKKNWMTAEEADSECDE